MNLAQLLFSFRGQIGRPEFWKGMAAVACVAMAPWLANSLGGDYSLYEMVATVAIPIGWWMALAIGAKRCRDRGRSPWAVLFALVPLAGLLWYLIELGMLPGRDPSAGPDIVGRMFGVSQHQGPFLTTLGWAALGFMGFGLAAWTVFITKVMSADEARHTNSSAMLYFLFLVCAVPLLWSRWRAINLRH